MMDTKLLPVITQINARGTQVAEVVVTSAGPLVEIALALGHESKIDVSWLGSLIQLYRIMMGPLQFLL